MPDIPEEIWSQILSEFSISERATRSDVETWADVTNIGFNALHLADHAESRSLIVENVQQKIVLCTVSRMFHRLCRPLLLEVVSVRSYDSLLALCRSVAQSEGLADDLGRYTLRLDVEVSRGSLLHNPAEAKEEVSWNADFRRLFSACHRLRYIVWHVPDMKYDLLGFGLFSELPKLFPLLEVLFWHSSGKIKLAILDQLASLRVVQCNWEYGRLEATNVTLPLVHTLRAPLPFLAQFVDPFTLPKLCVLAFTGSKHFGSTFRCRPAMLAHGSKIRTLGLCLQTIRELSDLQELFPNATHALLALETAERLFEHPWNTVEHIALYAGARFPLAIHEGMVWGLFKIIDNLGPKQHHLRNLRDIRILDKPTVGSLHSRLHERTASIARRLCDEIDVLDAQGQSIWSSSELNAFSFVNRLA